jgi:hypothetical protein
MVKQLITMREMPDHDGETADHDAVKWVITMP